MAYEENSCIADVADGGGGCGFQRSRFRREGRRGSERYGRDSTGH